MANDQFHIPGSEEQPLHDALRIADSLRYTPETQPETFQFIKDMEHRIHSYRETAVAAQPKKAFWLQAIRPFMFVPKSPYEKLVEKEGILGGQLFKKQPDALSQRFWYHDNGDWFYESVKMMNGQKQAATIRFQTTASSIHKLVEGVEQPFTAGEAEEFAQLPALYEKQILQLYPINATIQAEENELPKAA